MAKFYITTAIDYVNAAPHLGHAYEKICADVLARWHRLKGDKVWFLTGTDENAQKNAQAAKKAGIPVKKFVDQNSKLFIKLCDKLNISYDDFIRTTEERHTKVCQEIFKKVYDKGDIYKGTYKGLYCEGCEAYLTEKDLVDGKCPEHGKEPKQLKEDSYFFKMSKYQDKVLKLLESKDFVLPEAKRNEMIARVKEEGLKDLCVCRKGLTWGIDNPIDKDFKIYVWFDALINYYSGGKKYWPASVHLIGKGINWFHTVIWPSMLLSAGIGLPKTVFVHGYVNVKGQKLSKSTGKVVDPIDLVKKYGSDAVRYFLIREIPFGEDGDFSEDALKNRINNELANDLGNLVNRVVVLSEKKCKGKIKGDINELDVDLKKIEREFDKYKLNNWLDEVWKIINECNKYVNDKKPWELEGEEANKVLYNLVDSLRVISILIHPVLPESSDKINKAIGVELGSLKDIDKSIKSYNVKKGEILFKKVE